MGVYPAVDVTSSVSRVMNDIVGADHQQASRKFRRLVSLYMENRDLLLMGILPGQDAELDLAVSLWPALMNYSSRKMKKLILTAAAENYSSSWTHDEKERKSIYERLSLKQKVEMARKSPGDAHLARGAGADQ